MKMDRIQSGDDDITCKYHGRAHAERAPAYPAPRGSQVFASTRKKSIADREDLEHEKQRIRFEQYQIHRGRCLVHRSAKYFHNSLVFFVPSRARPWVEPVTRRPRALPGMKNPTRLTQLFHGTALYLEPITGQIRPPGAEKKPDHRSGLIPAYTLSPILVT